jgi:hypothetical protein
MIIIVIKGAITDSDSVSSFIDSDYDVEDGDYDLVKKTLTERYLITINL